MEVTPHDLLTDIPSMPMVKSEGVINYVYLLKAKLLMDDLYFIDHQLGVAKADPAPEHPAPGTKDAAIWATPASGNRAWSAQSVVLGEGQEIAGREGQLVQILDEGARLGLHHPFVLTESNPRDLTKANAFL